MTNPSYVLDSGEALHAESPETFYLPSVEARRNLRPGALAKLVFRGQDVDGHMHVERMWVQVTQAGGGNYRGILSNSPYYIVGLNHGDDVPFRPEHVIQIDA